MRRFRMRWQNFRGIRDSNWVEVRPITILIGANACGKTSLLAPLLLLKQTLESGNPNVHIKSQGNLFNAGTYQNLIFRHEKNRKLQLSFDFGRKLRRTRQTNENRPFAPPSIISLSFSYGETESEPVLSKYIVRDSNSKRLLERNRLARGGYSVLGPNAPAKGTDLYSAIRKSLPEHFLFSADSVFREKFIEDRKAAKRAAKESKNAKTKLNFDDSTQKYLLTVSSISSNLVEMVERTAYVGPLRDRPKRLYELSGETPEEVGTRGESAPEILYRNRDSGLLEEVNEWVGRFQHGLCVDCEQLTEGAFRVTMKRESGGSWVNYADTGFGLSQILPLVVQGLYDDSKGMMIAEQPEIHLNPKLQAMLAELFVAIAERGSTVLLETHSEHLLLRLRRLIAEGKIKSSDVGLYFVERKSDGDESTVEEIPIGSKGHIRSNDWPRGFFEEQLMDALGLAEAQSQGR